MEVIKRNSSSELFDFGKIEKVIAFACNDNEMKTEFFKDLKINLKDNMKTKDIHRTLTQLAVEKVGPHSTRWDSVASKLYLYNVVKEAGLNRGYTGFKYGDFYDFIVSATNKNLYHKAVLKEYSKEEIQEMAAYIDPQRDFLFSYVGIKTFTERYLVKGLNKEVLELPQEAFAGISLFLAINEKKENRLKYAKALYDELSHLNETMATPTTSNARKPFNNLSSCFIGTTFDSLESIYNTLDLFAQVSKHGGGMGLYFGKVRASNSDIRGFKNASGGIIPWIKLFNDTAIAVNQLSVRAGSISITLDIWHRDIHDFLQLKTNTGDERKKAHDIFPAISVPDLFMNILKKSGKFYLFCPHEIKTHMGWSLEDFYGEEFEKKYWECVNHPTLPKEEVLSRDLMKEIIKSASETGSPFWFFRDTVNRMNPNNHAGMIYSSNLCMEINQNMSSNGPVERKTILTGNGDEIIVESRQAGDFVVCNLASLNLGKVWREEDLARIIPITIRMLDNVIDMNYYPIEESKITNRKYRAIGLGTSGYHHMLVQNDIFWDSEEHIEFADKVYENINYYAIKASMELAKEKGAYPLFKGSDWHTGAYFEKRGYTSERWVQLRADVAKYGIRNAYIMAIAPTGSTSLISGSTATTDPVYDKFWVESKKGNVVPAFAPDLDKYFWHYIEAHKVSQAYSIKAAGVRQRHIDQSQSLNIYITTETTAAELMKLYFLAYTSGVKTVYYVRSRSVELEDCISCSS